MLTGSCLCRNVRFEVQGSLGPLCYCHCSECRRSTGSAFSANVRAAARSFEITSGLDLVSEYESSPGTYRAFCSNCGSPVYARVESEPDSVRIRLGSLKGDPEVRPVAHVWVSEKAAWHEITDELPRLPKQAT